MPKVKEAPFRVSIVLESVDWVDQGGGVRLPIPRRLFSFSVDGTREEMDAAFRRACEPMQEIWQDASADPLPG